VYKQHQQSSVLSDARWQAPEDVKIDHDLGTSPAFHSKPPPMRAIKRFFKPLADFVVKYPAVLSGYIIYAYLFLATMNFYREVKSAGHNVFDYVQNFDSLLWMWLLAYALVRVIEYRSKLANEEKKRLQHEQTAQISLVQLNTLKEVVRALQHDINNPLTIILAFARRAEKAAQDQPDVLKSLAEIKTAADRIAHRLTEFSQAHSYTSEVSPVGTLAVPGPRDDTA